MTALRINDSASASVFVDVALAEKRDIHAFFNQAGHGSLKAEFLQLNQISDLKAAVAIARQWIVIGAAFVFALWMQQWWSYGLAIILIATRQHALTVLMHEATHWRLFSHRWANDFFGNVFCAFPVQMMVSRYRADHLAHHQTNMSDADPYKQEWSKDPNWHWPKNRSQVLLLFTRDLLGLNMLRWAPSLWNWSPWSNHFSRRHRPAPLTLTERLAWYGFLLTGIAALTAAGLWADFFLLWVLPQFTVLSVLVRARSAVEHLNLPGTHEYNRTRQIQANWIESLTVAPLNINLHLAHHLFPSIPQYHLPRLHQLLLAHPGYQKGRLHETYFFGAKAAYKEMMKSESQSLRRNGGEGTAGRSAG